jgi:hypothetical protein
MQYRGLGARGSGAQRRAACRNAALSVRRVVLQTDDSASADAERPCRACDDGDEEECRQ